MLFLIPLVTATDGPKDVGIIDYHFSNRRAPVVTRNGTLFTCGQCGWGITTEKECPRCQFSLYPTPTKLGPSPAVKQVSSKTATESPRLTSPPPRSHVAEKSAPKAETVRKIEPLHTKPPVAECAEINELRCADPDCRKPLKPYITPDDETHCDFCKRKNIPKGILMYRCVPCSIDACAQCFSDRFLLGDVVTIVGRPDEQFTITYVRHGFFGALTEFELLGCSGEVLTKTADKLILKSASYNDECTKCGN